MYRFKKIQQSTLNIRFQQSLLQNPRATQQLYYFHHLSSCLHGWADQLNGFLRWYQMATNAISRTTSDRNVIGADRGNREISSSSLWIGSRASSDHLRCILWFHSVGKSNKWDAPASLERKDRSSLWLLISRILSLQPRRGCALLHLFNTDVMNSSLMHACPFLRGVPNMAFCQWAVSRDRGSERARAQTEVTY